MRTNTDITLYNRYIDPSTRTERFQRVVISKVMWNSRKASNILAAGGQMKVDQAQIFIPFARGAAYKGPKVWQALESKTGFWTLQVGDIVVKGICTEELHPAIVSPAEAAYTVSTLQSSYDNVLVISSIDFKDYGSYSLQHWQVGVQ